MIKTTCIVQVLREAIGDQRVRVAFVFGSIVVGEENAGSDVDLLAIGDIGFRGLSQILSGCSAAIGREINPYVMTEDGFRKRVYSGEHFISSVLK